MSQDDDDNPDSLKEERAAIIQLQSETRRKEEQLERITNRATALQDELATRREELNEFQSKVTRDDMQMRENKNKEGRGEKREAALNREMTTQVTQILQRRIPMMAEFVDEEEYGPTGGAVTEDTSAAHTHDVVLIKYQHHIQELKSEPYVVTYRIDRETTASALLEDACHYWGCSKMEFTFLHKEEDRIRDVFEGHEAKEDKVQKFLGLSHAAVLELVNKAEVTRYQNWNESQKKLRDVGTNLVSSAPEAVSDENWLSAFLFAPGIYDLLKDRDRSSMDAVRKRISLGSLVCYLTLFILSFVIVLLRCSNSFYYYTQGVTNFLVDGIDANSGLAQDDFNEIAVYDDIWSWLNSTFFLQIFGAGQLGSFYSPVGFMQVRQQASEVVNCRRPEVQLYEGQCLSPYINADDQETLSLIHCDAPSISSGRLSDPSGITWSAASPSDGVLAGAQQSFDGSGYKLRYDMSNADTGTTFRSDITYFRDSWLWEQSRVFSVELILLNNNSVTYVSCVFLFELMPSGLVYPTAFIRPFKETSSTSADVFDILRWPIILYIATYMVYSEGKHLVQAGHQSFWYFASAAGFLDMTIVALFVALQYQLNKSEWTLGSEFKSLVFPVYVKGQLEMVEAVLFFVVSLRLVSFFRIIFEVRKLSAMFARSVPMMFVLLALVLPVFGSLVFLSNCIWSSSIQYWSNWTDSVLSGALWSRNLLSMSDMREAAPGIAIVMLLYVVFVFNGFILYGFLAIVVHSYFEVSLLHGHLPEDKWTVQQWLKWALGPWAYNKLVGGSLDSEDAEEENMDDAVDNDINGERDE